MNTPELPDARERITGGLNRARLRLEARRGAFPLLIVMIGAAISLAAWGLIFRNVGRQVYSGNHEIGLEVSDASAVIGGGLQEVRFKGVPVGVITSVGLRDGRPFIKAKIYDEFWPIHRDAKANLRPNTALEDMYLDVVDRGTPAAGDASVSRPIPASDVRSGVQVEDVLQAFAPDVRGHLAALLDQLGKGLAGRGASLRETFVQAVPFLQSAQRLSRQLVQRRRLTAELVTNTGAITDELAGRDGTLRGLIQDAGSTLRTVQNGSGELDATLRELPGTLTAADRSLAQVTTALPDLDTALVSLRGVASLLPGGLAAAERLGALAAPALRDLRPSVRALEPLAKYLSPAASSLASAATKLVPQVPAIDHVTRDAAGCSTAIQGFMQWTPSVMKLGDARGAMVRGEAVVGLASTGAVKDPLTVPRQSCTPGGPVGGEPGPGGTRINAGGNR